MAEPGLGNFQQLIPGYLNIRGDYTSMYVQVDSGTRDGGTAGGGTSTTLMPGVVLGKLTASGRYTDYDNDATDGSQLEENTVVLLERIPSISSHTRAHVLVTGVLNRDQLRFRLAADKTAFEWGKTPFTSV